MQSASSSSIKAPKSVKKRSYKTPAKRAQASKRSKDSDKKAEQPSIDVVQDDANESEQSSIADNNSDTVREDQTFWQGELKDVNEYLKGKVGTDIFAKHWLKDCNLGDLEKSMVILELAYELCLAKDPDYDLENGAAENNKQNNFDTKRIFHILKYVTAKVSPEDSKKFTEFVCKSGNAKLLEMICKQENEGGNIQAGRQYTWKGEFTGYERLTGLLQYVLKQGCSSEIVLCIAKKVYGNAHVFCNGKQYLDSKQIAHIKEIFDDQSSVMEECLKTAIELSYKDVVQVMLGGDVYHCIRLMKGKKFQEEERFRKALNMVREAVAEVMSSWVNRKQDLLKGLLKKGIEVDINKMEKKDLIAELESRGIEVKNKDRTTQKELVKMLKEKGGGGKVILNKTVVGTLILTLFFNHQDELMKEPFKLKISSRDEMRKGKEINELNENIDKEGFLEKKVLEKIKLLNSSSHICNNWFFREVLAAIVNDKEKFNKLQAVCAAICEKPMERLLEDMKDGEDLVDDLKFFAVQIKTSTPKKGHSVVSVSSHFPQKIEGIDKALRGAKGIVRGMSKWSDEFSEYEILNLLKILLSDKTPAFSGLSRKIIVELKIKKKEKDIKSDEVKKLKEAVNQILGEIKKGIGMLARGNSEYCIDTEDTFKHFEVINSEIKKEDKREIVGLVCRNGNVKLLEMICRQENKGGGGRVQAGRQYTWKGEFTGYERLTGLLQYVLKQGCSSEIVLCIAKKVYGNAHVFCNGKQYLDSKQIARIKEIFDDQSSVMEECLKTAIELSYKDVVQVMLGGDVYHCIRSMKGKKFQEEERFRKALNMVREAVAEVMSSWVNCKQDLLKGLLKKGIEVDINKMKKEDLIAELESRGIEVKKKDKTTQKELVKMLKEKGGGGKVILNKTVVGTLILTLFFNYQKELTKKPFEIGNLSVDKSKREKEINELNENIDKEGFLEKKVLEKIKLLNSSSHICNNWFFREVLAAIVNDKEKFNKLQAVCTAICKEPMQKLLKDVKVGEDVVDTLKFFGVDLSNIDLSTVGPVETMDLNEYTSPSSATETNKLSGQDIVDIAKYVYRWMEPINDKYLEEEVFFTCTDVPSLSERNSEANSEDEAEVMQVESEIPPSSKAAKKKNEEVMQNNCRQNQNVYYDKEKVRIVAPSVNIFSEVRIMPKRKCEDDWSKRESQASKRAKTETKVIGVVIPKLSEFINMFDEDYKKKLLEYEFGYSRLKLLCVPDNLGDASGVELLNNSTGSSFEEDDVFERYNQAITSLLEGRKDRAVSELEDLANGEKMPHAKYALAVVRFKDLWWKEASECEKNRELDPKISEAIKWLKNMRVDDSLRPLNWSLLLKVQLYDVGGYGEKFEEKTELSVDDLLYKVLCCTKDTEIKFDDKLLQGSMLCELGNLISGNKDRKSDAEFIIKYTMYELLKRKMSKPDLPGEYIVMEDAFRKMHTSLQEESLFTVTLRYVYAEVLYGRAIYILKYHIDDNKGRKEALNLLNESCKQGHQGALYLRGTLIHNRKRFKHDFSNYEELKACLDGLETFAQKYKHEDAARIVANEYLRSDCFVRVRNQEVAEEKAREILEKVGCEYVWRDWKNKKRDYLVNTNVLPESSLNQQVVSPSCSGASAPIQPKSANMANPLGTSDLLCTPNSSNSGTGYLSNMQIDAPSPIQTAKGMNKNLVVFDDAPDNNDKSGSSEPDTKENLPSFSSREMNCLSRYPSPRDRDLFRYVDIKNPKLGSELDSSWSGGVSSTPKISKSRTGASILFNQQSLPGTPDILVTPSVNQSMSQLGIDEKSFVCDDPDPSSGKHLGIFLSPTESKIRRLSNLSHGKLMSYNPSSGIEVILNHRNKGVDEPDVLNLSTHERYSVKFKDSFDKAVEFCKKCEYDNAIKVYQKILVAIKSPMGNTNFKLASHNMAVVLYMQGKYDRALEVFKELASGNYFECTPVAQYNVAIVLCKQEKYDDALGILRQIKGSDDDIPSIGGDIKMLERQIEKSNPSTSVYGVGLERMGTPMLVD